MVSQVMPNTKHCVKYKHVTSKYTIEEVKVIGTVGFFFFLPGLCLADISEINLFFSRANMGKSNGIYPKNVLYNWKPTWDLVYIG